VLLNRWRTFEQLSWRDRWILVQALAFLPLTAVTLRVLSFARLQFLLSSTLPRPSNTASCPLDRVHATTRLVRLAADRGLLRVTCLPHSVVLWWLLRRQGADAVLRFGVRKTSEAPPQTREKQRTVSGSASLVAASSRREIEAHAWVEYGGMALNDDDDVQERFAAFDRAIAQ
jgi:Transglutaminase-like superfamily